MMAFYRPATAALALCLAPLPAAAWSARTQEAIAREAAQLAPPDLARQIYRHRVEFKEGALAPYRYHGAAPFAGADGGKGLKTSALREAERAVAAIEAHHPFAEVVRQLGVVSYYLAQANNPLGSTDDDPRERDYGADYLAYLEQAVPRMPLIFYGLAPNLARLPSLEPVLDTALARSRSLYPRIGEEYRRIGFVSGLVGFDDRSSAFGAGSLAFSHAVTDVTQGLIWIWLKAGGYDPRSGLPERGQRVLWLPRRLDAESGFGTGRP
jgi:hypothetical protein